MATSTPGSTPGGGSAASNNEGQNVNQSESPAARAAQNTNTISTGGGAAIPITPITLVSTTTGQPASPNAMNSGSSLSSASVLNTGGGAAQPMTTPALISKATGQVVSPSVMINSGGSQAVQTTQSPTTAVPSTPYIKLPSSDPLSNVQNEQIASYTINNPASAGPVSEALALNYANQQAKNNTITAYITQIFKQFPELYNNPQTRQQIYNQVASTAYQLPVDEALEYIYGYASGINMPTAVATGAGNPYVGQEVAADQQRRAAGTSTAQGVDISGTNETVNILPLVQQQG